MSITQVFVYIVCWLGRGAFSLSNGLGSGAEMNSWGRISIPQVACYTVYWLGQCVLSVSNGLGSGAELDSWERISITQWSVTLCTGCVSESVSH